MKKILKAIDTVSESSGLAARFFSVALILVMVTEVTMRYVFNRPTMWAYEVSIFLGAAIYSMAFAYVMRHNAHVRVDVFYTRLSPRGKAIIDVIGGIIIFLPLMVALLQASGTWTIKAWIMKEKSFETYWFPPLYPLRTIALLGFILLTVQGLAKLYRDFYMMIRNKNYD